MKTIKFNELKHGQIFFLRDKKFMKVYNGFVKDEFNINSPNAIWMGKDWSNEDLTGILCHFFENDRVQIEEEE